MSFKKKWIGISWGIVVVYCALFFTGMLKTMDEVVYAGVHLTSSVLMNKIMFMITFLGSWQGVTIICLLILLFHRKVGLWISGNVIVVTLFNQLLKHIVARSRPVDINLIVEHGYSFPSGHSMVSFALFGMIAYCVWKKNHLLSYLIMCIPLCIGISRIYLGVHFASDVLAGFLFSFAYLCTMISLLPIHKTPSVS